MSACAHRPEDGCVWAINRRKMACKRGHPFDEENTEVRHGKRNCRECRRVRERTGGINPTEVNAAKTECVNGHPFTAENTRRSSGQRYCLQCKRKATRESARRRRARSQG